MTRPPLLDEAQRRFVAETRRAILATTAPDNRPRLVPVCFVLGPDDDAMGRLILYTPLDEKPKQDVDPRGLARVRDLLVLPQATLVVDRWDEDWSRLAWLRLDGRATLLEPDGPDTEEHGAAVRLLRDRYVQYATHRLEERPMLRIEIDRVVDWSAS